jgi:hypothetical protein
VFDAVASGAVRHIGVIGVLVVLFRYNAVFVNNLSGFPFELALTYAECNFPNL